MRAAVSERFESWWDELAVWFEERGVSPVVGTVLMIAIVVILSATVLTFMADSAPSTEFQTAGVDVFATEGGDYRMEVTTMGSAEELELRCGDDASTATETGDVVWVRGDCTTVTVVASSGSTEQTIFSGQVDDLRVVSGSLPHTDSAATEFKEREAEDPQWECVDEWDGTGESDDPFIVSNDWELQCIYYAGLYYDVSDNGALAEPSFDTYLDANYALENDIDASETGDWDLTDWEGQDWEGSGWVGIGQHSDPFTGTFDGRGHEIRGLAANYTEEDGPGVGMGLFGNIYDGGVVKNVDIVDAHFHGSMSVGAAVGLASNYGDGHNERGAEGDGVYPEELDAPHIENVWVYDSTVLVEEGSSPGYGDRAGGIAGTIGYDAEIIDSGVVNTHVEGVGRVGGIVGQVGTSDYPDEGMAPGVFGTEVKTSTLTDSDDTDVAVTTDNVFGTVRNADFEVRFSYVDGNEITDW